MRKILILAMSLEIGGAEKSLVNILNLLDYSECQVDLLLFQKRGAFLAQVPSSVHIVDANREIVILFQSFLTTLRRKSNRKFSFVLLSFRRYLYTLLSTIKYRQFDRIRINRWIQYYNSLIPEPRQKYDIAIAYSGGETLYYMVDKVRANRKITYYHSDYSKINIDNRLEETFLDRTDAVVTISNICANSLAELFPNQSNKIRVMPNLTSPSIIRNMGEKFFPREFLSIREKSIIVSVGRLHPIKGFDIAVEAAEQLMAHGKQFVWFVIGEGNERKALEKQIRKKKLQHVFILLGSRVNPYPYIKNADIFVQPSRFEGKSVVLDEAKILCRPIVVTNYHSVTDQIENMETGIIAPTTVSGITDAVDSLLSHPELRNKLVGNLSKIDFNVQKQVENFQNFIEGI